MRTMKLAALALLPALALGACATGGGKQVAANDYDKLKAQCDARGGFLKPTFNRLTPYEALNNYCDVTNAPDPAHLHGPGANGAETRQP